MIDLGVTMTIARDAKVILFSTEQTEDIRQMGVDEDKIVALLLGQEDGAQRLALRSVPGVGGARWLVPGKDV